MKDVISLERIKKGTAKQWKFIHLIFEEAFPMEERRKKEHQEQVVVEKEHFYQYIIKRNDQPIGIYSGWDLGDFVYGEHLAIASEHRGGGVGSKVLKQLFALTCKPWVIECEKPEVSEMATRRIALYERLGMVLVDDFGYVQPSYHNGECIPMRLMYYGDFDFDNNRERIVSLVYSEAYNIKK